MSGSGQMALPDVREWSDGPTGCPGVVGRPSQMYGSVWKAIPDVREALSDVREWLKGSLGYSGVVGRPSRMSTSGREALPDIREW